MKNKRFKIGHHFAKAFDYKRTGYFCCTIFPTIQITKTNIEEDVLFNVDFSWLFFSLTIWIEKK